MTMNTIFSNLPEFRFGVPERNGSSPSRSHFTEPSAFLGLRYKKKIESTNSKIENDSNPIVRKVA